MNRRIFLIGPSGSGKTTALVKAKAAGLRFFPIKASAPVKERIVRQEDESYAVYCERLITEYTKLCAADNGWHLNWIECEMINRAGHPKTWDSEGVFVIDGIRNPHDFVKLHRPEDFVVFVDDEPLTRWERAGLLAIQNYLLYAEEWMGYKRCLWTTKFQIDEPLTEAVQRAWKEMGDGR